MSNKIDLPLKQVSILTDGAILTHLDKIELPKGEQIVTLTQLSEYLDEDSVRVKGKGKVILIDVSPRMEYITVEDEELSDLDKKIKGVERKIQAKELEAEVIEISATTLDETFKQVGLGFGEWGLRKGLTADDFNKYYEYYQKGARDERKKVLTLKKEMEDLQKELETLQAKRSLISHSDSQFYEIDITLDVKTAGTVELEVSYTISQARWEPLYMVDLASEKASIQRLARIHNTSGFDWTSVGVTITTANRAPVRLKNVNPFYLSLAPIYKEKERRRTASPKKMMMKPAAAMSLDEATAGGMARKRDEASKPAAPKPEIKPVDSDVSVSQTGHQRFEISGKHSIPSGHVPKTLHLDEFELPVSKSYHWSSTDPKLILTHEVENEQYFLLPGNAKVFISGEYISQTHLGLIHPKEKFTLGVVESFDIKVERKLVIREVSKKGLVRGKRQMDFGYEIKIENMSDNECKLKLIDRIPHALDENVDVELNNILPEPTKKNQGVFEWEFELPKDDKQTLTFDYSVRYPPERKLSPPL